MEKIKFIPDGEAEAVEFFVIEQTRLRGVNYLLVTETEDESEDADAYILKDLSADTDTEAVYEFVEDDKELEAVSDVFEKLLVEENEGQHLTVEELHARVNAYLPEIGLATVYRTIQLFLEMGLADRIDLNDGQVRYEIADAGDDRRHHRHHHLICVKCGRVWAFEGDLLEELESRLMTELSFQVINHEVKLFGYCQECRNI